MDYNNSEDIGAEFELDDADVVSSDAGGGEREMYEHFRFVADKLSLIHI